MEAYTIEDFRAWLKVNDQRLRGHAPDEIVRLAMACGFDVDHICGPVADHTAHLRRLFAFWENPLADLWIRVTRIETGTDDETGGY